MIDVDCPYSESMTFDSVYWLIPSSIHASSNSFVATMPYQYWWPNSCSTTCSGKSTPFGMNQLVPPVMNVGYSIPKLCDPGSGSTTVIVLYGKGPYQESKRDMVSLVMRTWRSAWFQCEGCIMTRIFTGPMLPWKVS